MEGPHNTLAPQVVLVTGAGSGIGRATAIATAGAGARVIVAARSASSLEETAADIRGSGGLALVVPTDVTDPAAVQRLIASAVDAYGRLDVVVHAAGTNLRERTLDELTPESWASVLAVNLTAAYYLTQMAVPVMRGQGGGLIIYVSSSAAKKPDRSGVAYQASKAGLVGLAHGTMEEERNHGVRTTVIFPGLTDTPLVLKRPVPVPPEVLHRALKPNDVAAACLFVMSLQPHAHVPELAIYPSRPQG